MAVTPIFTMQDAVEYTWEVMNPAVKPPTGRELRIAKMAAIRAYRDLANRFEWSYYKRRGIIRTEAYYKTGTVAFDFTGGTYERQLTLTTGTWPTNAARGQVVISNVHYPVESRKSDSVVTLDANINPGADVAAATSYEWYRDAYPLPVNFRRMGQIIESTSGGNPNPLEFVNPSSLLYNTRYESGSTTADPDWYTIRNAGDYMGSLSMFFGRGPTTAKTYDMLYEVSPRPLRTYKYATGTITLAAGSTALTGNTTAFTEFHEGCIIRFTSSTTVEPTDMSGNVNGDDNPYIAQRSILAVASGTAATIDSEVSSTTTLTTTKYTISDPIDIEPIIMRSPFEALCLYHFARLTKRKDAVQLERDAEVAILNAMEQDRRTTLVETGALVDAPITNMWGTVDVDPT